MAKNVQTPARIVVETSIGRVKFRKTARGFKATCKGYPAIKVIEHQKTDEPGDRDGFQARVVMSPGQVVVLDQVRSPEKAYKQAVKQYWA